MVSSTSNLYQANIHHDAPIRSQPETTSELQQVPLRSPSIISESGESVYYDAPIMHFFSSKRSSRNSSLDRNTNANANPSASAANAEIGGSNQVPLPEDSSAPVPVTDPSTSKANIDVAEIGSGSGTIDANHSDDSGYESSALKRQTLPAAMSTGAQSPNPNATAGILASPSRPMSRTSGRTPVLSPKIEHDEGNYVRETGTPNIQDDDGGVPIVWSSNPNDDNDATIRGRRYPTGDDTYAGGDGSPDAQWTKRSQSIRSTRSMPASRSYRSDRDRDRNSIRTSASTVRRRRPSIGGGSFASGAGTVGPNATANLDVEAFRARSREADGSLTRRQRSKLAKNSRMCSALIFVEFDVC